jgi:hypothetical protein
MAISDNIKEKAAAIHDEFQKFQNGEIPDTPIATEVRTKSTQAILKGNKSKEWIDYMQLFAKSTAELDHLIPNDGTTTDELQKRRCYLVANGMCSMGTTDQLPNNVGTRLD